MSTSQQYHFEQDAVYVLVTFRRRGKQDAHKKSNLFFPVYVGMVDAALAIDPAINIKWHRSSTWDAVAQSHVIQELIARQADGIIMTASGGTDALNAPINAAIHAGIPVITFDSDAPDSERLSFVGTNNVKAGYQAGKAMSAWLNGQGNVLVINIPGAEHLEARAQGFRMAMRERAPQAAVYTSNELPDAQDVALHDSHPMRWRSLIMRKMQEHPDIAGIFITFGESSFALGDAIESLHRQNTILALGFDVDATAIKFVNTDRLRGIVEQDLYLMGYVSMILAHAARQAPVMPTRHDGRWRLAALQTFLDTHSNLHEGTDRKLRKIIGELDARDPTAAIDTGVEVLEKVQLLEVVANDFERMRESLADKIDALGDEIHVRKQAERELLILNEELEKRVQERTAEIAQQKYILDTFLETVPDRIWFKDREGRYLRANQAHARRWGLRDPAEEIGKTDADLMPSSTAQITTADERKILDTGVPLVNKEAKSVESDGDLKWSLVTKMPLRDEHGAIIGTFGIARDITPLKQAQTELEQRSLDLAAAYEEIQILNTQLQEENLRMGAELDVSRRIQKMVLPAPEELQQITGLDIVGYMQPADEVGGDYYDVLEQHGVLYIGVGDVTGHGLESGILMLMTQTAIRTLIEHGETDPKTFLTTLNRVILKNAQRMQVDKTLTFALVQYQDGNLHIVGQHEEILVVRQGGTIERIDTLHLGFPLGLVLDIADFVDEATVVLHPGDCVVLYTDGVTEAENPDNQMYGLDRLCAVLSRYWNRTAEAMKQAVIADVTRHIGTQKVYDDMTLVVLKQQ